MAYIVYEVAFDNHSVISNFALIWIAKFFFFIAEAVLIIFISSRNKCFLNFMMYEVT